MANGIGPKLVTINPGGWSLSSSRMSIQPHTDVPRVAIPIISDPFYQSIKFALKPGDALEFSEFS